MNVRVNGEKIAIQQSRTIFDLLKMLEKHEHKIAVAVNSQVVPRSEYGKYRLCENDEIEVIHAVGGG